MVKQQKTLDAPPTSWVVAFGHRLERARGRMGLTQAELAGADLSKSFVSLLETARSYPSVETLLLLARRAGTSIAELLVEGGDLRLDAALTLLALAREAAWTRSAWAGNLLDVTEALLPDMPGWMRAEWLVARGMVAAGQNRFADAERLARQGEEQADRARFLPGKAHARALAGRVAIMHRDFARAHDLMGEAVALYREAGALRSEPGVKALIWLGTAIVRIGRPRSARRVYQKARRLAERLHLPHLEGQALWGLGHLAWSAGDLGEATSLLLAARDAFQASEDLLRLADVATNLAALYRDQGRLDQALAAARQAVQIMEHLDDPRGRSSASHELATVLRRRGDLAEAHQAAQQALRDADRVGDRHYRALALRELGRVAAVRGQRPKAVRHLQEALRLVRALRLPDPEAEIIRDLGTVRAGAAPITEAAHYLAQAIGQPDPEGAHHPVPVRRRTRRTR